MARKMKQYLAGWRFPVTALALLLGFAAASLALLLIPASDTTAGRFAAQFRVWCFGWDAARGVDSLGPMMAMLFEPLLLAAMIALVWAGPLREAFTLHRRKLWIDVGIGLLIASALGYSLLRMMPDVPIAFDFPADALRTEVPVADFSLTTQHDRELKLSSLRGRVVMITAVYSQCGYTCPKILAEARRVLDSLSGEEKSRLTTLAITLDPEHDAPAVLRKVEEGYKFAPGEITFLTGDVAPVLESVGIRYKRDPQTGSIDHANMFVLIDAQGRMAYRFALDLGDGTQERWLKDALHLLLAERR